MSSQEEHPNSGEVVSPPEAQPGLEAAMPRDPVELADTSLQAQPNEEFMPSRAASNGNSPAALSAKEASEPAARAERASVAPAAEGANESAAVSGAPAVAASTQAASATEPPIDNSESDDESLGMAEVESLMESMEAAPTLTVGEIVQGHVLSVTGDEVVIDLGLKCEAVIPRIEFSSGDGEINIQPGQTVRVMVEKFDELGGTAVVSRHRAMQEELWEEIERAFYEEKPIRGRVVQRVKGGLEVNIGVHAFMPASQADLKPHPSLDEWIGQEIECKVIKLNRKRDNVVVSRRKALEEESNQRKTALLEHIAEGVVLRGRVKNLTDYGAFVDLGGIDGLLHMTDLSWARVAHPSEVVQAGQEVEVKVLKFDREKERVSLGIKQLAPDPWETVASHFHAGDHVTGKVVSVTDYGAFVELEPGVEGLIHTSEMSWTRRLRHPSKILKPGEMAEVAILNVNPEQRRISLSLRQALPDPWKGLSDRMGAGTVVKGRVRHFTDFGAFIEVEEGVDGLIHVSNLSWTRNVKHPSEMLRKGQEVEAVVLNVDMENRRLSLGLKQLQPDAWESFFSKTNVGDMVHAKVTRRTSFGVFAEIEEGIEGLCHISEIGSCDPGSDVGMPKVGDELEFRVIRLNPEEKKISLSTRSESRKATREREKAPEPVGLSRMAEAFSSAGITTPAMARASGAGDRNNSH
ncbi:MAG: S1 RNA-binding domain-containing protein [Acidobacteria bacterium]|nr:MAG: S1 RNA-binding domain-containing protein [Acidobacteriota bacterium]